MQRAELLRMLRRELDEKRFLHCLAVAESAAKLAERWGADREQAELAGLLHDIMKCAEEDRQLQIIRQAGILLQSAETSNPNLLHAIAGEAFLRQYLPELDASVLGAVRWHTTGRPDMSLLEKVVYLADFISADRMYPDVETVRSLAKQSLDDAIAYTLRYTIEKLRREGREMHPASLMLYQELTKREEHGIL